jgi:hypothetical protein
VRESAVLGSAASWPDWTDARILDNLNDRHLALQTEEIMTAQAGYGLTEAIVTCTAGQPLYPIPDRAAAGTIVKLELQVPGNTTWYPLTKVEITEAQLYDIGPTKPGQPYYYSIQDGFAELYQTPASAFLLKFTFYMRPSTLVTSQSSTEGGDGVVRGLITQVNTTARTVTVNVLPNNNGIASPTAITNASLIDIIHPTSTFALAMYSQPISIAGTVITLTSTDDMARIRVGDFVRVAEQTDWPNNLPVEWHRMLADRAAMEITRSQGRADIAAQIAPTVAADLERFRVAIRPQAKNAPKALPLQPFYARGRGHWLGGRVF